MSANPTPLPDQPGTLRVFFAGAIENAITHWRTTLTGLLLAAIAVTGAIQQAGHNPYLIITGVGSALLGMLSKDN